MTAAEIDAEVERVARLVRDFLERESTEAEMADVTDLRVQTWMLGAVMLASDGDDADIERVGSAFESRSRIVQLGMADRIYADVVGMWD